MKQSSILPNEGPKLPVCGYCGNEIVDKELAFDPRDAAEDGSQRVVHTQCEKPFRAELAKSSELEVQAKVRRLLNAAARVWSAYLGFGPVDDGRPEGKEFSEALDELMLSAVAAGAKLPKRRSREKR